MRARGALLQSFTIREEDGQFCLYSKDGSKKLGCHDTREDAEEQERAIQARKAFEKDDDDAAPSRTYLKAYLSEVKKHFKRAVSREKFSAAMKTARAKAGGVMRSRKAARSKGDNAKTRPKPPDRSKNSRKRPTKPKRANFYPGMENTPKLSKDDASVAFKQGGGDLESRCGTCRFFAPGACAHVEGTIEQDDVCMLWRDRIDFSFAEPTELVRLCSTGEWAVFLPLTFAEEGKAQWIPFLPVPGNYVHPSYGVIVITPERNKRFVENFRNGIYQASIPIDAEHELKASGALGYAEEMRVNKDGSVDAKVKWTERGARMLNEDRFRYVSPEWYDEWTDPSTGQVYRDVIIGGALTTRPFFKDKALRPLVAASENLSFRRGKGVAPVNFRRKETTEMATEQTKGVLAKLMTALGLTSEDEAKAALREIVAPEAKAEETAAPPAPAAKEETALPVAASERIAAAEAAAKAAQADAKQAREEALTLKREARRKHFSDIVFGRLPEQPHRWFGGDETRVAELEVLADKLGEDSKEFKDICAREAAYAKALSASAAFREGGYQGATEVADNPESIIQQEAMKLFNEGKYASIEKARVAVWDMHPELKRQHFERLSRR